MTHFLQHGLLDDWLYFVCHIRANVWVSRPLPTRFYVTVTHVLLPSCYLHDKWGHWLMGVAVSAVPLGVAFFAVPLGEST
jgi:hypothetical protein